MIDLIELPTLNFNDVPKALEPALPCIFFEFVLTLDATEALRLNARPVDLTYFTDRSVDFAFTLAVLFPAAVVPSAPLVILVVDLVVTLGGPPGLAAPIVDLVAVEVEGAPNVLLMALEGREGASGSGFLVLLKNLVTLCANFLPI